MLCILDTAHISFSCWNSHLKSVGMFVGFQLLWDLGRIVAEHLVVHLGPPMYKSWYEHNLICREFVCYLNTLLSAL